MSFFEMWRQSSMIFGLDNHVKKFVSSMKSCAGVFGNLRLSRPLDNTSSLDFNCYISKLSLRVI